MEAIRVTIANRGSAEPAERLNVLIGLIGAVSAISGLASASLVVALNTVFLVGLSAGLFGSVSFAVFHHFLQGQNTPADLQAGNRKAAVAAAVTGVVLGSAFYFGLARPLDEEERAFNSSP